MSDKGTLLSELSAHYEELYSSTMGLRDDHMTRPVLGDWSAKDILAHIVGWQRVIVDMLERMAAGQRPRPDGSDLSDTDGVNARFVAEMRDLSPEEVMTALHAVHADCVRAAEALPEERFSDGRTASRLLRVEVIGHYDEHAAQIFAWRDGLKDAVLQRHGDVLRPRTRAKAAGRTQRAGGG